jgi:hypothetical protein
MKTKFKATICGVALLILGLVMQAAAVSKIGFLDPYWMLRHLQEQFS